VLLGGQDCLQLLLELVNGHLGKYIQHHALVLKSLCIDADPILDLK
jgi:hypothetical protein